MSHWIWIGFSLLLLILYSGLLVYFSKGFRQFSRERSKETPNVTVIVPAHNEENNLPHLLDCLSVQTYPLKKTEIILVDDRSTDRTYGMMKQFAKNHPQFVVQKIINRSDGPSPKKNAIAQAVRASRGEIILTTDADTRPGRNWIQCIVETYDPDTGAVLGYAPYRTDGPYNTFFHKLLALEYFSLAAVALSSAHMGYPATCNGANFSYRRSAYNSAGGFGETLNTLSGDDDLLLHRLRSKTKWRIRYAVHPDAAVFNNPPKDFRAFFWQRVRFSSKHLAYPFPMRLVLLGVYLFYGCLLLGLVESFVSAGWLKGFGLMLATKTFFELIFLIRAQRILEKRNLLKYYPFAVVPHVFYVVLFPLLGQLIKPRWK